MKAWARNWGMLWATAAGVSLLPELVWLQGAPLWYAALAAAVAGVPLTVFGLVTTFAARGRPDHGVRAAIGVTAVTAIAFWALTFYPQMR